MLERILHRLLGKRTKDEKKQARLKYIRELMAMHKKKIEKDLAKRTANEYFVDGLTVSKHDGSVLISNEDGAFPKATRSSSLLEYVNAEIPNTNFLVARSDNGYHVIYKEGDLLYIIKSSGDISIVEAKALARQVSNGMKK